MVVVYFNTFENTYYIFVLSDKHFSGSCQIHCCVHDDPKKTLLYLQQY